MVATVFVGNLYDKKDRPVPEWAQTAFLYYAARLLGYCTRCVDTPLPPGSTSFSSLVDYATEGSSVDGGGHGASPVENGGKLRRKWHRQPSYRLVTLLENPDCTPRTTQHKDELPHNVADNGQPEVAGCEKDDDTRQPESVDTPPQVVYVATTGSASNMDGDGRAAKSVVKVLPRNNNMPPLGLPRRHTVVEQSAALKPPAARPYAKDWANVAAVCDRLFFWLCFVLTVVTTGLLFHPLMWRPQVLAA